ncbi:MAG: 8-amino-7-oxononanoate synthase [Planctomyces sp.]|nr:8-amino-7-oxononanoate synthase [Planctomyces sp.]
MKTNRNAHQETRIGMPTTNAEKDSWTGILESPPGAEVSIDGERYLYFAGTAYLALQGHPEVIEAGCEGLRRYGVHTATARGGYGTSPPLLQVEHLASQYFGSEAAFYYVSGYWGNQLVLGALKPHFDSIFFDEQSHSSILDAIQISGKPSFSFPHRSVRGLGDALLRHLSSGERPLVISDGVFASSGRIAPIDEYRKVIRDLPGAILVVDDAHSVGVLGDGLGTFAHFGISFRHINQDPGQPLLGSGPRLYSSGTLSKAIGGSGGIIAGSRDWISRVRSSSACSNAASSPGAPVAMGTAAGLRLVMIDTQIRQRMVDNTRMLRRGFRQLGFSVEETPVPFFSIEIGNREYMQWIQGMLRGRGIIIAYAQRYSGVGPEGNLRIAVSAAHTDTMIQQLVWEFGSLLQERPLT